MRDDERPIDGSQGAGGGPVWRTALALSAITNRAAHLVNIRAGMPKPGLQSQHLTAVRAAARASGATVQGDALGSQQLGFRPGPLAAGSYFFDAGTERASAGSATPVFQTMHLPLTLAGGGSRAVFAGGAHNPWPPPRRALKFLELVKRGPLRSLVCYFASSNLPKHVRERQAARTGLAGTRGNGGPPRAGNRLHPLLGG